MSINPAKFHHNIRILSKENYDFYVINNSIISSVGPATQYTPIDQKVQALASYLHSQRNLINAKDRKNIQKIIHKLEASCGNSPLKNQIDKILKNSIDKETISPATASASENFSEVLFRVADAPQDFSSLLGNLTAVANKFPKYQLGHHLEVYDTTHANFPKGWAPQIVRQQLQEKLLEYKPLEQDPIHAEEYRNLAAKIESISQSLKPMRIVPLAILIHLLPTERGAMLVDIRNATRQRTPCLIAKPLIECHAEAIGELLKSNHLDLYVQTQGNLAVLLPKEVKLEEAGFNLATETHPEGLVKWEQPLEKIAQGDLKLFAADFLHVLQEDTVDTSYQRIIYLTGHGTSGLEEPSMIAGLPTIIFQQVLTHLKTRNMAFLAMDSCFSGGANSTSIHLLDGTIPCPIAIGSATELSSFADEKLLHLLKVAPQVLFTPSTPATPLVFKRSLTQKIIKEAFQLPKQKKFAISNLATYLLPASKPDISKIQYLLPNLEVTEPTTRLNPTNTHAPSTHILSHDQVAYLLSGPLIPAHLIYTGKTPIGLVSKGGKMHHYIPALDLTHISFADFLAKTFNPSDYQQFKSFKAYVIGTLKCGEGTFGPVVIGQKDEQCAVIYQKPREQFYRCKTYKLSPGTLKYQETEERRLPSLEAQELTYKYLIASSPNTKTLLQVTAGRLSERDFYEAILPLFAAPSPLVELMFKAIFQDEILFTQMEEKKVTSVSRFRLFLDAFKDEWASANFEAQIALQEQRQVAYRLLTDLNLLDKRALLHQLWEEPLLNAVKAQQREVVTQLLVSDPNLLYRVDAEGNSPLSLALKQKNEELAQFLLQALSAHISQTTTERKQLLAEIYKATYETARKENSPLVQRMREAFESPLHVALKTNQLESWLPLSMENVWQLAQSDLSGLSPLDLCILYPDQYEQAFQKILTQLSSLLPNCTYIERNILREVCGKPVNALQTPDDNITLNQGRVRELFFNSLERLFFQLLDAGDYVSKVSCEKINPVEIYALNLDQQTIVETALDASYDEHTLNAALEALKIAWTEADPEKREWLRHHYTPCIACAREKGKEAAAIKLEQIFTIP